MIPAVKYLLIVRQYANARGLPFFTYDQMQIASKLYNEHAAINN